MEDRPSLLPERLSALPQRLSVVFKPRRWRRVVPRVAAAVGLGAVFLASTVTGLWLHLWTNEARRVTRRAVNAALASVLDGRIELGEIESLSFRRARIREVWIYDPAGNEVIYAEHVEGRVATNRLLRTIFLEDGPIRLSIPRARIERARVSFHRNALGIPTLADTFLPRDKSPSIGPPGRPFVLRLPRIEIGEAEATGDVGVQLDATVRKIHAAVHVDTSELVAVDVSDAHIDERALLGASIAGAATYHMTFDLRSDERRAEALGARPPDRLSMRADLNGTLAGIPASAAATMVGVDLDGRVVMPEVTPELLAGALPGVPLAREVGVRGVARGRLPELWFEASVDVPQGAGMGVVTTEGALDFANGLRLSADVRADEIDPRLFAESIPEARLNGHARVALLLPPGGGAPRLAVEASTHAAELGGHILPAVDAVLHLHEGELLASATVWEAGIPLDVRASHADGTVSYSVVGASKDIAESPRIAPYLGGAGTLRVDGTWKDGRLEAAARADLAGVATRAGPNIKAGRASVEGTVRGPLDALELDATATSAGLELADEHLDRVTLSAKGPLLAPAVTLSVVDDTRGKIDAAARVSVKDQSATGVTFDVKRGGVEAKGRAEKIALGGAGPVVSGATISGGGLGQVEGTLALDRGELVGKLKARDVDLERAATLLGLPFSVGGLANVDVDVARAPGGGRAGHVEIEVEGGTFAGLDGVSTRISAKLKGKEVETSGYVRLVDVATADARADAGKLGLVGGAQLCDGVVAELRFADVEAALAGPLLDPRSWTHAVGSAEVIAENWNLGCLAERLPARSNPFDEVGGIATMRARIARAEGDPQPSVEELDLVTRGLVVVGKDESFESRRLDISAEGGFDGKTGTAKLETVLRGSAFRAELETVAILDLGGLMDPARRDKTLRETQFEANLTLPRRPIEDLAALPEPLAEHLPDLDGELRLEVEAWGTPSRPELHVLLKGFGVAAVPESAFVAPLLPPVDLSLDATFDPDENTIVGDVDVTFENRSVAAANATVFVNPRDLLNEGDAPLAWKADLFAQLFDFPLGSLPVLSDRNVVGAVSGRLAIKGLHDEPSVEGALSLREVKVGDVALSGRIEGKITPRAKEQVDVDAGAIDAVAAAQGLGDASLRVDLEQQDGGNLQVLAYAGAKWEELVLPTVDTGSAGGFALSAQAFRLTALHPFVADVMSRLDGRVDGSVAVEWGRLGEAAQGRFSDAKLDLSNVIVFIPQVGQELREGKGAIRLGPTKTGTSGQELLLERFEAKGISGRIQGEASARFQGLKFVDATGKLSVKPGEDLPITVEGVPIGKARGEVAVTLAPRVPQATAIAVDGATEIAVGVKLTQASIELPASSGRNVQSLDPAPGVRVLQPIEAPAQIRSQDAIRWIVTVDVVDAAVRSSMLDTRLNTAAGRPVQVVLSDRLHASGDVSLNRGNIQLQNRRFEIDQALVRLRDEEPGNPYVNLTAHWDSPDGTRVFVDYVGILQPITDSKIRFRSDPPKPQAEVLALLLFGDTGEKGATATGLVGTVGSTVATSIAGDLVAAVFGGVFQDVAVNLGETEEGSYYGAQLSVTEDWRIGGQYEQFGQGTTNASSTQRRGGCADLFADWGFARNWSLRGSTGYCSYDDDGDAGQSNQDFNLGIDVLWQYRY